jgi:hypothetical protein
MTRRRALWLLGFATLVLLAVLVALDGRMEDAGGHGIVPFELAGSDERAGEILADWGEKGRDAARASLWLDFAYLAAYGAFLWLAIRALRDAARRRGWTRFARPGSAIALLPLAGAACDAVEDVFLLLVLGGHGGSAAPAIATAFAIVKFACVGIALLYLLGGLIALGATRRRARPAAGA